MQARKRKFPGVSDVILFVYVRGTIEGENDKYSSSLMF